MKERKYKEDYSFRSYITDRGKEKREVVYNGDYFQYADGKEAKQSLYLALGCWIICAGLFVFYVKRNSPSTYCMYVLPVAACAVISMVYWAMGLFAMGRAPQTMTRLQKENGIGRVLRSAVGSGVLLTAACIGDVIFLLVNKKAEEWLSLAVLCGCAAVSFACYAWIRKCYHRMYVCGKGKAKEEGSA